jgi:hypothetical protein
MQEANRPFKLLRVFNNSSGHDITSDLCSKCIMAPIINLLWVPLVAPTGSASTMTRKLDTVIANILVKMSRRYFLATIYCTVGRNSSVGITTRYRPDRPGIESWWGRNFPHPSRPALGPPSFQHNRHRVPFPTVKRPECVVNHLPPSSTEVKEKVEL